jgi:carnosine N-methyltransferase
MEQPEDQSEQFHLMKVITAFAYYKRHSLNHNHRRRRDYLSLSEHHKKLIPNYLEKVNAVDERIEANMSMIREIVKSANVFLDKDPMTLVAENMSKARQQQVFYRVNPYIVCKMSYFKR